jgi:hypothetical protein
MTFQALCGPGEPNRGNFWVGVSNGLSVGVGIGVRVGFGVDVGVGIGVDVGFTVGVGIGVGVGVSVGLGEHPRLLKNSSIPAIAAKTTIITANHRVNLPGPRPLSCGVVGGTAPSLTGLLINEIARPVQEITCDRRTPKRLLNGRPQGS